MKRATKRLVDGWNQADTDDPLSDLNAPRAPRGRKNTRKWCRGKVGVEHVLETVVHHTAFHAERPCHESTWLPHRWYCHHAIRCTSCGKYLQEWLPKAMCPDAQAAER